MSEAHILQERLVEVGLRIENGARDVGREPKSVRLIAVGKTYGPDIMRRVIEAGQRLFGENRVQEAMGKWPELKKEYRDLELHLIGPMQSNKVKDAVALFDVIHSVDRAKIARVLGEEIERNGRRPKLLVQVNTGEEAQKGGVYPREVDDFVKMCGDEHGLEISGLMCIPPVDEEPSLHFALLAKIADRLGLEELSMGMSSDFETAIQFGATYVRVGSSIFGERK